MTVTFSNIKDGIPTKFTDVKLIILGFKEGKSCYWVDFNTESEVHAHVAILNSEYQLMNVREND